MTPNTHLALDRRLCGAPIALSDGKARVRLITSPEMTADDRGLVHGGFVFGAADHAAMLAVNDPFVVLGGSESRFVAPVMEGDVVEIVAERTETKGRKHVVEVEATVGDTTVFTGTFTTFVLDAHVLDGRNR